MSIEGERIISKMVPPLHAYHTSESTSGIGDESAGWNVIVPNQIFQWNGVLDLSGLSSEHLTTFFTGLNVQEPYPYSGMTLAGPDNICYYLVTDVISNIPFDASIASLAGFVEGQVPGFLGTTTNWDDVIMGAWREVVVKTEISGNIGAMTINQTGSFGSAEASASNKLYFTRTVVCTNMSLLGDWIKIPPARFVAGIAILEEPTHEYLMRLKRSSHNEQ